MASSKILYAQSRPLSQTVTTMVPDQWEDMKGLALTLPKAGTDGDVALVILNVPNPYASGNNPACNFTFKKNGAVDPDLPIACFSYPQNAATSGRTPTTLIAQVRLGAAPIALQAVWESVRQSTVTVDTPCTLSAIIGMG